MKQKSLLLIIAIALSGMMALQAKEASAKDSDAKQPAYISLSPLDTTALPDIATKDCGGHIVRSAMNGNTMWRYTQKILKRNNFSDAIVYKTMVTLYKHTHKHYVSFPVSYWSESPQGDSLLVSGRIYLPKGRTLNGIVIANHYTMTADVEAPSNMISMESMYTMKGYAVIMPDYVGYGLTRDKVHPYLHWRNAAQTAVDLLERMPEVLNYYGYSYPKDVVISGYSQGGAVALGVARMLEEMDSDWSIRKLYAGAGPYDPAATYIYSVERDTMGIPAAIPLIVMGLSDAYDLGFELKDFFKEPMLSHYDEWIMSKQYSVKQINDWMGSIVMTELMTQESLDFDHPLAEMLYETLVWNSNVGYALKAPAYFLHSIEDEVVPLINTENLIAEMPEYSMMSFDIGYYGSHMEASIPFMKYVYQDL